MQRRDQRFEVGALEKLHLVEQEHDTALDVRGDRADLDQQLTQIARQIAAVSSAQLRFDIEREVDASTGAEGEGLQDPERAPNAILQRLHPRQFQERRPAERCNQLREPRVVRCLGASRHPAIGDRDVLECLQQHRLTDPAEPGDEQALLRVADPDPPQHRGVLVDLPRPAGQCPRDRSRTGRVRTSDGIHDRCIPDSGTNSERRYKALRALYRQPPQAPVAA